MSDGQSESKRLSHEERVLRLWHGHRAGLLRYARSFVVGGEEELAEDLVQTLFERLLDRDPELREIEDPEKEEAADRRTAFTALRNLGCNGRRRERVRRADPLVEEGSAALGDATEFWDVLRRLEVQDVVRDAFGCLTLSEREVMELVLDGYTGPEIAEHRRSKPGTVRALIHRARKRMGGHVERACGGDVL